MEFIVAKFYYIYIVNTFKSARFVSIREMSTYPDRVGTMKNQNPNQGNNATNQKETKSSFLFKQQNHQSSQQSQRISRGDENQKNL